jgi:hypothetical protein
VAKLQKKSPAFVVVDSLDEVHPNDYAFVLSELERFALHSDREFIHVVVFGRPLAFRDYWSDRRARGLPYGLSGHVLNPPDFRTTGDLRVSTWNYDCWKFGLSRVDGTGEAHPMSFEDFQRWCDKDFATVGEFANVSYKENRSIRPEVRDELERWAAQHRVVTAVLPNLAGNSIAREIVEADVECGKAFDERRFMEAFFARWLERDSKTDNRPSRVKPDHLDLYLKLLEAVAIKYIDEGRLSPLGYFEVNDDDRVFVQHGDYDVSVPVRRLLNRSGLVNMDAVQAVTQRYRFEPFWIHRHLVVRHLERSAQQLSPAAELSVSTARK